MINIQQAVSAAMSYVERFKELMPYEGVRLEEFNYDEDIGGQWIVTLRTAVTTNESDLAWAPCDDLTRVGGIPGMAVRQYGCRHDRHARDSATMGVCRLEA